MPARRALTATTSMHPLARPAAKGLVLLAAATACAAPKGSGASDSVPSAASGAPAGDTTPRSPTPPMPNDSSRSSPPAGARVPAPPGEINAPPIARPPTAGEGAPPNVSADVRELWNGQHSPLHAARRTVVRSAAEWATLSAQLPGVSQPSVDWTTHMLILAALGDRPSGGHSVQVTGFARRGAGATVTVTATRPGAGCMTTMALTAPAVLARVPRVEGEVTFEERTAERAC